MKAIRAAGFTLFKWALGAAIGGALLYGVVQQYDFCSDRICSSPYN